MLKSRKICSVFTKYRIHLSKSSISTSSWLWDDAEYLHKSTIPTMHFQKSLPRLKIPKLEDTIERFLNAQKPLLNAEGFSATKAVAENFLGYEGRALHALLMEKDEAQPHTSYISGPWYDMYLRYRDSIVLNHNPFILTTDDPHTDDQLTRASKLIYNALRFKKSLDAGVLKPDVFHIDPKKSDTKLFQRLTSLTPQAYSWYVSYMFNAYPLDMSQYSYLFNSTRVPKLEKDELKTVPEGRQILVIRNGNLFLFDAMNEDGSLVSRENIHANLAEILAKSETKAEHPLAVMTAVQRDMWAKTRDYLSENSNNASLMHQLDSALFSICLDDEDCNDEYDATRMFLYGGDGSNRWFDKSFHMGLSKNAKMAINFEHAWGDGVAIMRFLNETIESSAADQFVPSGSNEYQSTVVPLEFEMDEAVKNVIQKALDYHSDRTSKLKMSAAGKEGFGRNHLKSNKLGPDSVIQLAFQMAYYRQNGRFVPTYESCSTSAFKHGRTETLRPCTTATVACCEAFETSHPAGVEEMLSLLKEASTMHNSLTKEAVMGQGFDRHLFALRSLAESCEQDVDFFNHDAYRYINNIILSTSTVFSDNIQMGGFAPVVPNGFGISYLVKDDWMGCNASSYPDSPNAQEFTELVCNSLDDIKAVIEGRNFKG